MLATQKIAVVSIFFHFLSCHHFPFTILPFLLPFSLSFFHSSFPASILPFLPSLFLSFLHSPFPSSFYSFVPSSILSFLSSILFFPSSIHLFFSLFDSLFAYDSLHPGPFSLECYKTHQRQHDLREAGIAKRRFQCHVCLKEFTRGTNLTTHLKGNHNVQWPEGLKRFKYVLYEDGFYRLQVRSRYVTQRML